MALQPAQGQGPGILTIQGPIPVPQAGPLSAQPYWPEIPGRFPCEDRLAKQPLSESRIAGGHVRFAERDGNGAWFDIEALAIERARNRYANLNHRATSRLYGIPRAAGPLCSSVPGMTSRTSEFLRPLRSGLDPFP